MTTLLDPTLTQIKPKTMMTALATIIAVHALVATGLMNMPTLDIKPLAFTVPLEISWVKPMAQSQPNQTHPKPPIEPKPLPKADKVKEPNESKTSPTPITKPKAVVKQPPINSEKPVKTPITPMTPKTRQTTLPTQVAQPVETVTTAKPKIIVSAEPSVEQKAMLTQQANEVEKLAVQKRLAEQAEQQRQAKIQQDAENARQAEIAKQQVAQKQAKQAGQQEAFKQQQLEQQKAKQIAEEAAEQAKKLAKKNEPVNFGNGDAQWKTKPNLNFSGNVARIIDVENLSDIGIRLNVGANGHVISVMVTRSSGNTQVDSAVSQRLLAAKLKPFIRNGVAVPGAGNLTINLH